MAEITKTFLWVVLVYAALGFALAGAWLAVK